MSASIRGAPGKRRLKPWGVPFMGLFTSLAEQSFTTDAAHRRLFNRWSGWSRPYIIPDTETELQIKQKIVWRYRLVWVAGVLYLAALPNIESILKLFMFGVLLILCLLSWLLFYIFIMADVKHLSRALEKVNHGPAFTFSWLSYTFLFLSAGYALAGVWKFATGNVEAGYFWVFGGLAIGAVVLGVFLWRRLRSAAAA
jgi:hypothetical protein